MVWLAASQATKRLLQCSGSLRKDSQTCAPAACGGSGHSRGHSPRHHHLQRATGAVAARGRVRRALHQPARGSWHCPAPTAAARTAAPRTGALALAGLPPAQPGIFFPRVARFVEPFLLSVTICNTRSLRYILPSTPTHSAPTRAVPLGLSFFTELISHSLVTSHA